ncbi:MAG: response regulator [Fusobacteria bacterium]|jgi:DNA-binding response OmpR family regulator|nr:response regulator [Fusobacteriota bacterium]
MEKTILLIDDEYDVVDTVETMLKGEGFKTLIARNGEEGLKLLKKHRPIPDLILLDIMMPVINGVELCGMIREIDELKSVPIVMFTAKTNAVDKKKSFDAGANGFISKPFNTRGFIASIKTYLELGDI